MAIDYNPTYAALLPDQAQLGMEQLQQAYQHKQYGQSFQVQNTANLNCLLGNLDTTGWTMTTGTTSAGTTNPYWVYANENAKPARSVRFFRVNSIVELAEGALKDPLDDLRLKVARWLNPKEQYNFA